MAVSIESIFIESQTGSRYSLVALESHLTPVSTYMTLSKLLTSIKWEQHDLSPRIVMIKGDHPHKVSGTISVSTSHRQGGKQLIYQEGIYLYVGS